VRIKLDENWAVPTSLFLNVMGTKLIECLIKACQELKMPTLGTCSAGRTLSDHS
jgi:hypothetical protein